MSIFKSKNKDKQKEVDVKSTVSASDKKPKTQNKKKESMKDLYGGKKVTKTTAKDKDVKPGKQTRQYGEAHRILVKPLITEKAANLGVQDKYVFEVSLKANKIEITKAIKEVYGIEPISVNVISVKGKKVRQGRTFGRTKDRKKAIVALPKGKTINIYEGV